MKSEEDIYFQRDYGRLYERCDFGKAEVYELKTENGLIRYQFIKRVIPEVYTDCGEKCFDIRTPYGYGGPIIVEDKNRNKLLDEFKIDFANYCKRNNIITEFIRFHPVFGNALDFQNMYDIRFNRKTVGTNMVISENPIEVEFSAKCRKNIRRILKKGLSYKIIEKPYDLKIFKEIYYNTMNRNEAENYYYFDEEYFTQILKSFREKMIEIDVMYNEEVIAAGIYFVMNKIVHVHLSGTLENYLSLSPAYILRYALAEWSLQKGIELIHHGGGKTTQEDDSLYRFKKQFGMHTSFDFYIAEKIWDQRNYYKICELKKENETVNDYIRREKIANIDYCGSW